MTLSCYREATNGAYFVKGEHWPTCSDPDCRGCQTCAEGHCMAKKSCANHVGEDDLTCARCIGRTRTNLKRIVELAPFAAIDPARDSVDGAIVNLAGPVADPVTWDWRQRQAKDDLLAAHSAGNMGERALEKAWAELDTEDERHPGNLLPRWAKMLAEDYELDYGVLNVTTSADRIDRLLVRVAQDPEQDFPLLSRELNACRNSLETAFRTAAAARAERGAPCPECTNPDTGLGPRLERKYAHWCWDEGCTKLHYADDSDDRWVCKRCRREWTLDAYDKYLDERAS